MLHVLEVEKETRRMCYRCDDVCWRLDVVLYGFEMPVGKRRALRCMMEALEGELYPPRTREVMRCALLFVLKAIKGELCLPELMEVSEVPKVIRCAAPYAWSCRICGR